VNPTHETCLSYWTRAGDSDRERLLL